ncbi:MAG: DeoR/GlpR family DNA-binding transcription regulator [Clostridia bacterium]
MDNASKIKPVKMAAEERRKYILSMLEQYGSVTVSELSEHFGISEVSVRKLLISLEQDSLLQRTWGGAVRTARTTAELPYQVRESKYLQEKMAIARAAYDMINDGDSVYLDSGTTTFELAKLLCNGPKRGILVATNALDHAGVLLGQQGISLILIGGEIRHDVRACSGYLAKDMLSNMVFDKGFLGIEHISFSHGLTTPNNERRRNEALDPAHLQAELSVLADYSKFWNDSLIQIAPADRVYRIITDWHIAEDDISRFQAKGVSLVSAPAVSNL